AFKNQLNAVMQRRGANMQVTGVGTILGLHMRSDPIHIPYDEDARAHDLQTLVHLEMMMRGFTYAQRGYMSLSLPITTDDQDNFAGALDDVISVHSDLLNG
ncbi:MAG: aspartate aminotransferase family protein, partial [Rhodospirillales bacterium]|nr:aspartate aminotransferase family protein [Rhodospirillales bacterium]